MCYEHHPNFVVNSDPNHSYNSCSIMTACKSPSLSSQSFVPSSRPATPLDKRPPQLHFKAPHRSTFSPIFLDLEDNYDHKSPSELGPCSHSTRSSLEDTREDYQDFSERSHLRSRSHTITAATVRRALYRDPDKTRFPFPNPISNQRESGSTVDTRLDSGTPFDEEFGSILPRHPLRNRVNSKVASMVDSLAKSPTKSSRTRDITHRPESSSSYSTSPPRSSASLRIKPKKIPRRGAINLLKSLASSPVSESSPQLCEEVEYDWAEQRRQDLLVRAKLLDEEKAGEAAASDNAPLGSDGKIVLSDEQNEKVAIRPKSWELTPEEQALRREQKEEERKRFIFHDPTWVNQSRVSAHPRHIVPYPFAYDNVILQIERHSLDLVTQLFSGRPSVHGGELVTPPPLVLDLGCGDGSWMIDAVQTWRKTRFYGLDLQNLHPSRSQLVADLGELANNITFTYYNFLMDKLPYLDEKFDMVRMANLKWAIPENKLDFLLEEIHRVLKRGGWVEIIDDDFQLDISPENTLSEEQYGAIRDIETQFKDMLSSRGLPLNRDSAFMAKKLGEWFGGTLDETFPIQIPKGLASSLDHSPLQVASQNQNERISQRAVKPVASGHDSGGDQHHSTPSVRSRSSSLNSDISYTSVVGKLSGRNGDHPESRSPNGEQMSMCDAQQPVGHVLSPARFIPFSQAGINIHSTHNMQSILASKEAIRTYILEQTPELGTELEALRLKEKLTVEERQKFFDLLFEWNKQQKALDDEFWTFESALPKSFNLPQSSFDFDDDEHNEYHKPFRTMRPSFYRSSTGTSNTNATNKPSKSHKSDLAPSLPTSDRVIRIIRVYTGLK